MSHLPRYAHVVSVGVLGAALLLMMMPHAPARAAAGCTTTTPAIGVTVECASDGDESITVPTGATRANVVVIGGGGGSGGSNSASLNSGAGGNAAVVTATLEVVAPLLSIRVASGGVRDNSNARGAAGGGYSLIRQSVSGTVTPMVIAGGGGGGSAGLSLSGGDGGSGGSAAVGGSAAGGDGGSGPGTGNFPGGLGGSGGVGGFASEFSNAGSDWALGGSGAAPKSAYAGGGGAGFGGGASGASSGSAREGASGGGAGGSYAHPDYATDVTFSTADRSGVEPFSGAGGLSVSNEIGRNGYKGKVQITFLAPPPTPTSVTGVGMNNAIDVSWVAPADVTGITGYQVQFATSADGAYTDAFGGCAVATTQISTATTCRATGLTNGVTYYLKVRAFDETTWTGYSAASAGVTPEFSGFVTVGTQPWGVAISPDGTKAYIGNSGSDDVSVIDLATNEVSSTITTSDGAAGVVINPAGTEMYVGNFNSTGPGSVSKVNITDNTLIRTDTAACSFAGPLQMSPTLMDSKLLYTCANEIRSMDITASPMASQQITKPDEYGDLVALDSNSFVYVNRFRKQVVHATLSGGTWSFPWSLSLPSTPFSLAIAPDGLTGVTGSLISGTLTFFDVATGSSLGAMNVSSGGDLSSIAYDPTGSTIYVTNKARNQVVVVDVPSRTELGTIPVGAGPQRIALTRLGDKAVVTNNALNANTVSIFDITLQAGRAPTLGAVTRTADGYTVQVTNFDADYVWGTSTSMGAASIDGSGLVTVSDLAPGGSSIVTVSAARFMYESGSASASGLALDAATIPLFKTPESKADGFDVEILNWNPIDTWTISTSAGVASAIVSKVVTITGLSAGQSATVTAVTSKSGSVDGEASVTGRATTGVPSSPTIFLVGAGDRRATVTWLAPGSDGGSVILDYTVTAAPGDRFCTTPDDETTSCIVTGLTNGVAYTFTVTARNDVGSSPPSAASAPITPRPEPVAPGAPTGVVGVAGNGQIEVSWLAPTNNGGSVIEGYQVQVALTESGAYTDAAGGCALARTESWAGVECQATGLVNGQTYSFKVRAQNGVGWGTYSLASNGIAPIGPPAPVPPSPSPGGGGSSSPGGSDPSDPTPAPPLPEAPAAPSTKHPDQPGASKAPNPKPVTRNVTIRFTSGSAQLSARSKQALNRVARESRQARSAKTVAAARLTSAGATSANRVLARQRTTAVCSYLRSANIHGSCSTKTWILKPGQKGVGPSIRVRLQATPR